MSVIKIESSDKAFSSYGGMILADQLFSSSRFETLIGEYLPSLKSGSQRSFKKFNHLTMAFCAGADCIQDLNSLGLDPGFQLVCQGDTYTPKSYGDFLRQFSQHQAKEMNRALALHAYGIRSKFAPKCKSITIDIDSTPNIQHGKKIEGAGFNYKNLWCLDTLHAFDEYGLQYWCDVRPGSTYSSNGAVEAIHHIFKSMPQDKHHKGMRRYFRGDSAFCNIDVFNACMAKEVGFVCCFKRNMLSPILKNILHWNKPKKKKRPIKFYDGRECELGETIYYPEDSPHNFRVVVMRAVKKGCENLLFKDEESYDYYSFVTSIGAHEMNTEKLIRFYRKRGQAENFIKEMKYNYDLLHYPCLKLTANKVWAVIAGFAHNLMRGLALMENVKSPKYAKQIRLRLIHLPCHVVQHAGQIVFRFMKHHFREVSRWKAHINQVQYGFS